MNGPVSRSTVYGPEITSMTVWPSVAGMSLGGVELGRLLGQLYSLPAGFYVLTLGNLFCLLAIPLALVLYFKRIGPFVATRYRLTNQRIVVERGLTSREERAVDLDRFDTIDIEVRPGQEPGLPAGERRDLPATGGFATQGLPRDLLEGASLVRRSPAGPGR